MNTRTLARAVAVGTFFLFGTVLGFFGVIFQIASSVSDTAARLNTATYLYIGSISFFVVGLVLVYLTRKPSTVVQKLEVSGQMAAVQLKCPNCLAPVDASEIRIVSGVPYATCRYCGHTFEVAEEPKW